MTLSDLTVVELRKLAKKRGLTGYSKLRKAELVKKLARKRSNSKPRSKSRDKVSKLKYKSSGTRGNPLNKFFDRIFIINLPGKDERFKKVSARLQKHGIKYDRFEAIDGRCKTNKECNAKKRQFEKKYRVKIDKDMNAPAASLGIGTILLLRKMVRNKWKRVLICEDDIEPARNINKRFEQGVKELEKYDPDWDLLYLGCGNRCGYRGISKKKTKGNKHKTCISIIDEHEYNWFVKYKNDLRSPCKQEDCKRLSKNLSWTISPKGTWCYAYSLKGAKKMLKIFDNQVYDHIDQMITNEMEDHDINVVAFDPPVVWHEAGALRPDSDIPWEF